jgi:hypothetical protein
MKNKSIDKLSAFEFFLMEAAGENTNESSKINVELIVPKPCGDSYVRMKIPEGMGISGLAKTIGAKEIEECKEFSGHGEPGELHDHAKYMVITDNFDRTYDLIRNYKHNNSN